jgi:hypothetical protein
MILQNKKAIIYGAGGSLGGAVAKAGVTVDVTCGTTAGLNYRVPPKRYPGRSAL